MTYTHEGGRALPSVRMRPAEVLLLAAWSGVLTGLAEVTFRRVVLKYFLYKWLLFGPHILWMAPLADAVLFALVALVLLLGARRWPELVSLRAATGVFAFLGFLSLLLLAPGLHAGAALLLAAGLAAPMSRLVGAHSRRFRLAGAHPARIRWLGRGSAAVLVALVAGLALGVHAWKAISEWRALAKVPAASPGAPNVLLIVLDTVRAQSMSLYGYVRPTTPELERLAETGVLFERAIAPASWTVPSHRSMFKGLFPHELGGTGPARPTLAAALSRHGYVTAGFTANIEYTSYETYLNRGFAHYEDYVVSPAEIVLSSSLGGALANDSRVRRLVGYHDVLGRKTAEKLSRDFQGWLRRERRRPFFVFLNYWDAHKPYLPPAPFDERFGSTAERKLHLYKHWNRRVLLPNRKGMSSREVQAEIAAYDGSIAYIDRELGRLFEALRAGGVLQNTLVIVTSDHGEQFGEHGLFLHGNSLYRQLLHVPLLIWFPGRVPAGVRVREPVTLRDIPAMVLDLVGLGEGGAFPGVSLARHWDGRCPDACLEYPLLSGYGPDDGRENPHVAHSHSMVADGYHYLRRPDDGEELYDFENDPLEVRDLAGSESVRERVERFRSSLEQILARDLGFPASSARAATRGTPARSQS